MTFAEQLQELMRQCDLTPKEVSVICNVDRSSLSKYLNGKTIPNYETAQRIFRDLGYDLGTPQRMEKKPGDLRKNGSGYLDPTAYKAIRKVDKERERMMKLLDTIFTICDYAGFHVEGRITLRDKKTGRVWR